MGMKPDDLMTFILDEAQHRVINDECTKSVETALSTHTKKDNNINLVNRKGLTNPQKLLMNNVTSVKGPVIPLLIVFQWGW